MRNRSRLTGMVAAVIALVIAGAYGTVQQRISTGDPHAAAKLTGADAVARTRDLASRVWPDRQHLALSPIFISAAQGASSPGRLCSARPHRSTSRSARTHACCGSWVGSPATAPLDVGVWGRVPTCRSTHEHSTRSRVWIRNARSIYSPRSRCLPEHKATTSSPSSRPRSNGVSMSARSSARHRQRLHHPQTSRAFPPLRRASKPFAPR